MKLRLTPFYYVDSLEGSLLPATRLVAGFHMPAGGPLSFQSPAPPSAWRFFLIDSREPISRIPIPTCRIILRQIYRCM